MVMGKTDRIVRKPEVVNIAGVSSATLWRWERDGKFPKRISLGPNTAGWLESEINQWLKNLAQSRETIA